MSTQSHLESDLSDAPHHSSSRDQEIAEIKHRKLRIKDEIVQHEARLTSVAPA